jgi:hypothetical protein
MPLLPNVRHVERTVVVLKPDVVLFLHLDRVQLEKARTVQLRFQAFNEDGRAQVTASGTRFSIQRPLAVAKVSRIPLLPSDQSSAGAAGGERIFPTSRSPLPPPPVTRS